VIGARRPTTLLNALQAPARAPAKRPFGFGGPQNSKKIKGDVARIRLRCLIASALPPRSAHRWRRNSARQCWRKCAMGSRRADDKRLRHIVAKTPTAATRGVFPIRETFDTQRIFTWCRR
jgi:hypothetical protein